MVNQLEDSEIVIEDAVVKIEEEVDPSVLFNEIANGVRKYKKLLWELKETREEVYAKQALLKECGIAIEVTLAPIEEVIVAAPIPAPSVSRGPENVGEEVPEGPVETDNRSTSEIINEAQAGSGLVDPNFESNISAGFQRAINVGMANAEKAAEGNQLGGF